MIHTTAIKATAIKATATIRLRLRCAALSNVSLVGSTNEGGVISSIPSYLVVRSSSAARNADDGFQAAARQILQSKFAAVGLRNVARDAQPQAYAPGCLAPGTLHPVVRLQYALEQFLGYPRSIILHPEYDILRLFLDFEPCLRCEFSAIIEQIGEQASPGLRARRERLPSAATERHRKPQILIVVAQRNQ